LSGDVKYLSAMTIRCTSEEPLIPQADISDGII